MELPLFPLNCVLFPGRPLPLHVFEPRYRRLLEDCQAADGRFGVVAIRSGVAEGGGPVETFDVGTIAEIVRVDRLEDGRANLLTRGTDRFRIERVLSPEPYPRADVSLLTGEDARVPSIEVGLLRRFLVPYLTGLGAPSELIDRLPRTAEELTWLAASAIQVEVPEQQRLLELDHCDRIRLTLRMLRRESGLMRHLGTVGSLRPAGPGGAELN